MPDKINDNLANVPSSMLENLKRKKEPTFTEDEMLESLNSNRYYLKNQIDKFNKISRLGFINPYGPITVTREYVFFTKMDLHLFTPGTTTINPQLQNNQFFVEACKKNFDTAIQLQESVKEFNGNNPFCNLLTNSVASSLELQDIAMESVVSAANIYGTILEYPLATTSSSNNVDFSLEFNDNKNLDVYMFFRIWQEYELLKKDGGVTPPPKGEDEFYYITNKILHDQMSCFKIIVDEDMETILYWAKCWGVYPTSIPRSIFNDLQSGTLKVPVSFKCQWVEDMDPLILSDFNKLVADKVNTYEKDIPIYNTETNMINGQWCNVPHIVRHTSDITGKTVFKLKWR